ncbi:hypothetical protein BCR35DRAFT_307218, partial [Leucosporidium creatinivorum]
DWLIPPDVTPFDPNQPPVSLADSSSNSALLRGATPSNAVNRLVGAGASRGASSSTSGASYTQGGAHGLGSTSAQALNGILSSQVPYGGLQHDLDVFPSLGAPLGQQATRGFVEHSGDIPVDGYPDLRQLPFATTGQATHLAGAPAKATPAPNSRKSTNGNSNGNSKAPSSSSGAQAGKQQHAPEDAAVPEAALHLLRLALPTGSNGSVATATTLDEEEVRFDDDGESVATSVYSEDAKGKSRAKGKGKQAELSQEDQSGALGARPEGDLRVWEHADGQPPLQFNVGGAPRAGSGRGSAASSAGARQRGSAGRAQREQTASTCAGSDYGQASAQANSGTVEEGGRRKSGRVRKTILPDPVHFGDSDGSMSDGDDDEVSDLEVDDSDSDVEIGGRRKKGKGRASTSASGSAKGKGKRLSQGGSNPTPAKKPRTSTDSHPPPPRRPRRARTSLSHLINRTLPATVPIDPAFARFYRAFPISAAFPPESYVHRNRPPPSAVSRPLPYTPAAPPPAPALNHDKNLVDHFPLSDLGAYASTSQHALPPLASTSAATFGMNGGASNGLGGFDLGGQPPIDDTGYNWFMTPPNDTTWNKASDPFNLYAPRFVKGSGADKCGMCPVCIEPVARGGFGEEKWLKLKNSSFVYHMSYAHGISNITGLPFSPPAQMRSVKLNATSKDAREIMREGLCHKCDKWIPLDSTKNLEALVPELFWWKHAKKCHNDSRMEGDRDCYLNDTVFRLVSASKIANSANEL